MAILRELLGGPRDGERVVAPGYDMFNAPPQLQWARARGGVDVYQLSHADEIWDMPTWDMSTLEREITIYYSYLGVAAAPTILPEHR